MDGRDRGIDGFLHTVEEDPVTPNLLFAGGEFGLFVSVDRGERWFKWTHGLPTVPVRSLTIHPRDHDLVIGTHGRAIWILDDIRPLRAIAQDPFVMQESVHLFETPAAYVHYTAAVDGYHFAGDAMFQGESRPEGALLTYWLSAAQDDSVQITVSALGGETQKTITGPGALGLNRISWDLRMDMRGLDSGEFWDGGLFGLDAPQVLPGDYTVTVRASGVESSRPLSVLPDPRVDIEMSERERRRTAILAGARLSQRLALVERAAAEVRVGAQRVRDRLSEVSVEDATILRESADELLAGLADAADLEPARGVGTLQLLRRSDRGTTTRARPAQRAGRRPRVRDERLSPRTGRPLSRRGTRRDSRGVPVASPGRKLMGTERRGRVACRRVPT